MRTAGARTARSLHKSAVGWRGQWKSTFG